MQDTPLNRIVFGGLFIVIGIVLIVFHRKLRELGDRLNKYDPLLRQGDWWTGEYTRGGLILTDAITILLGVASFIAGLLIVFHVVKD